MSRERELTDAMPTVSQADAVLNRNDSKDNSGDDCAQSCGSCSSCACGDSSCGSCQSCASCGCDGLKE